MKATSQVQTVVVKGGDLPAVRSPQSTRDNRLLKGNAAAKSSTTAAAAPRVVANQVLMQHICDLSTSTRVNAAAVPNCSVRRVEHGTRVGKA
jgi:hypothetical protein